MRWHPEGTDAEGTGAGRETDKIPDSFLLPLIRSRNQPFVKAEKWNRDKEGLTERQKKIAVAPCGWALTIL